MRLAALSLCACLLVGSVHAQRVQPQEHVLENGLKLLLLPRKGSGNIAAGWVARVGSVNERPGITGISHLFEHMMFKGTNTIGTRNSEEDAKLNLQLDQTKAEIRKEERELNRRARVGEIEDPKDPRNRSVRHNELLAKFDELQKQQRALIVPTEFDRVYSAQGASGMNAATSHDWTIYFINVPTSKLELWFWMESDRLANPVFCEFYSERDVVHEERRLRTDSTPTGRYNEQFEALFWKSSPYGWPVVGWASDLESITREEANEFYARYYAPNNLSAALVGDFDPAQALELAKRYFGRLRRGVQEPEPVRTTEVQQLGEQRMVAYAETNPEVRVRWHTVADGHKDEPALLVLAGLLNDRTGRLYRSLVLEKQIATSANAGQEGRKYEGFFEMRGIARPGKTPEDVEQALYKEIERLQAEPVSGRELEKVKNQEQAASYRRLTSDFGLLFQLLIAESGRGWQSLNTDPGRVLAVKAEDVQRVARQYLKPENRNVLVFYRKSASTTTNAGGLQ
jgi:predicted Zn-dependent peptidase